MFWGGVMFNRRILLIQIQQNMYSHMYVEQIITPIIYPIRNELRKILCIWSTMLDHITQYGCS